MAVMLADFIRQVRLVAGNGSGTGMQWRSRSQDVGGRVGWIVCVISARRMPGSPSARIVELRGEPWITGGPRGRSHKVFAEQVQVTGRATVDNPMGNIARIVSEVPVVQRQLSINLAEQLLEPVNELTVPRQKLWATVHMGRLVYLVLLEPPAHPSRRGFCLDPAIVPSVQLSDRPHQQAPFPGVHLGDISPNSIA